MTRAEASKKVRELLKAIGVKAKFRCKDSFVCDYVLSIDCDKQDEEKVRKMVRDNNLRYSDPENDAMRDYFGCNNALVFVNGCAVGWSN